jgi:hypothetical protein
MTEPVMHHLGELTECPACGSELLSAVCDGERTKFFCEACAACWLLEFGWATRVNPDTCPGCLNQPQCLAAKRARQARAETSA